MSKIKDPRKIEKEIPNEPHTGLGKDLRLQMTMSCLTQSAFSHYHVLLHACRDRVRVGEIVLGSPRRDAHVYFDGMFEVNFLIMRIPFMHFGESRGRGI